MKDSLPFPGLRWRGLTLQLFALVVLPLIAILLVITIGSINLHQRAMRTLVGERDERAARTAANALSERLIHRAEAVRGLALRAADGIPPAEILASSQFLQPDFTAGLAFFSPQGELLASQSEAGVWKEMATDYPDLLLKVLSQADLESTFSVPFPHPVSKDTILMVSARAGDDMPISVGAFSPDSLARRTLSGALTPGEQAFALVVSADNQILYQVGDISVSENLNDHPGVRQALQGESGTTYLQVGGSEHVVAFSPVQPIGWALVIEEPWEAVANPLLNTTQLAPLILVPVLVLALVALWFGARQIVQPLQDLESRAGELAWGDYEAIEEPVGGIEEIEHLQNTLVHLAHKVRSAQQSLRGYIGAITTGQEEERRRLARELHDDTIQALVALNQRVQLAQMSLEGSQAVGHLSEIQVLTEGIIHDLRRLTQALRPLYLEDLGLVAALEVLANDTDRVTDTVIEFKQNGREFRLASETELSLYRMAQEGLSNVVRHAQAERASLSIHFAAPSVSLSVVDDGRGFEVPESPAEFAPSGHFGLLGMHERAELIGAVLEIDSEPGGGTRLVITLGNPDGGNPPPVT